MKEEAEILFEVGEDGVAIITLNRPDKLNAFTTEMLAAWADALRICAERKDIRVVVLTGAGRGFCSGGDVRAMNESAGGNAFERKQSLATRVHQIPLIMDTFEKPVLVAVNGVAAGAGLDMALMGDIRIAARSARFSESYIRVGIFAGDGGTWYLPRIVGMSRALEMLWTGKFIDAQEAERIGLVSRVVDDEQLMTECLTLAREIAAQSPLAVQMIKRAAYHSARMDLRAHLDMASSHLAAICTTADHQEALAAFREKRKGEFQLR